MARSHTLSYFFKIHKMEYLLSANVTKALFSSCGNTFASNTKFLVKALHFHGLSIALNLSEYITLK